MITALSAVIIGVVALIIGAYQTKVSSDQRASSVWPYLTVKRSSIQGSEYMFKVINKGVGPAIIKQIDFLVDGKPMQGCSSAFRAMINEKIDIPYLYSSTNKAVVAVQETVNMVEITHKSLIKKVQASSDNIVIKICYCSIYQDCWLTGRGKGLETKAVNSCDALLTDTFTHLLFKSTCKYP